MEIFGAVGEVIQVDETLMDAVTALAGSGPAFVFLFMEGLIDAGVRCGLPRQSAKTLAFQTVAGAVSLAMKSDKNLADLKESITSPGGTTIAGLAYLESAGFKGTIIRALEESANRSRELGK
jgi:pyrroline-5-carboxylate reductase